MARDRLTANTARYIGDILNARRVRDRMCYCAAGPKTSLPNRSGWWKLSFSPIDDHAPQCG